MMISPAPIRDTIADQDGFVPISWALFFESLYQGDTGNIEWAPTWQSLTEVGGSATFSTAIFRPIRRLAVFFVRITPVTNTSAVAGTTYIDNFPLTPTNDGVVFAVTNGTGSNSGHFVASSNRIYVPAWTTVTTPITLVGLVQVQG